MADAPVLHLQQTARHARRSLHDNVWVIKDAVTQLRPLDLLHPMTRVGNRLLDRTTRVCITIPVAPP